MTGVLEEKLTAAAEERLNAAETLQSVQVVSQGRVHRHKARGVDKAGMKDIREKEDSTCAAGLRNAADFEAEHADMQSIMNDIAPILLRHIHTHPELRDLHEACGHSDSRKLPPL